MRLLQGQLDEGVLANLLQYLALNRASGCLTVRTPQGLHGEVFLDEGKIVYLRAEELGGTAAMSVLLTWDQGSFNFRTGVASPDERLDRLSVDNLLLEASKEVDEARRTGDEWFSEQSVLTARPIDQERQSVAMTMRAIHLYRSLDGRRSLREIAETVQMPLDDVLEAARELGRLGLTEAAQPPSLAPAFLDDLTRLVVEIVGPMGEIIVEDALYDLELRSDAVPRSALDDLLEELAAQFKRNDWQRRFRTLVRDLRRAHGLGA